MRHDTDTIVAELANHFGAAAVKVCSEYHVKVTVDGAAHNVYRNDAGLLKLQLQNGGRAKCYSAIEHVIARISNFDAKRTAFGRSKAALELAELVAVAKRRIPHDVSEAVFVDAGWKDGLAVVGFVHVQRGPLGFTVRAGSRPLKIRTIHAAELLAIKWGLIASRTATVFSDAHSAAAIWASRVGDRVKVIGRKENKAADKMANCRGKVAV